MIPPIYTDAWNQWLELQIAERIAYCEVAREKIYFASNGSDISGDGSQQKPYLSLAKAQQLLDNSNGYIELCFNNGFYENHQKIDTNKPFVKITCLNGRATFSSFKVIPGYFLQFNNDNNTYYVTNMDNVVWVKERDNPQPYAKMSFAENVEIHDGSFYWDPDFRILYINPIGDSDPNTNGITYEYNQPSDACFIMRGDGNVIENVTTVGYGMNFTTPTQQHGIDMRNQYGKQSLVMNCESYYGSSHAMVYAAAGAEGGMCTFIDCKAGYTMYNGSAGETVFNTYAYFGHQNTFFINCEVPYGTLPSFDWFWEDETRGRAFFGHTGGQHTSDLIVLYNSKSSNCGNPSSFNDLPEASNLEDVKCFIVGDEFSGVGNNLAIFSSNTVRYNCKYSCDPTVNSASLANWHQRGWFINSAVDINLRRISGRFAIYNGSINFSSPKAYNSLFYFRNSENRNQVSIDYDSNMSNNGAIINSIIHVNSVGSFIFNNGISYIDNAYSNIPNGNGPQINYTVFGRPECNSLLTNWTLQLPIENDIEGDTIVRKCIGPWETWGCADFNKDNSVDFFDYLDFVNSDVDINGDATVDFFDYLDFINYWNAGEPQ